MGIELDGINYVGFKFNGFFKFKFKLIFSCMISSTYSEEDSSACRMLNRPSISLLQLHLMSLFASGMVMASFVFTPSSLEIWTRYFRRKFGKKVEEPLKLQKHKVIAQAFAKRKVFQNQGRLSISFHNSHTDPVGLKFDVNSAAGSHDFSSTWANNLPRFVNRRYALTGCPSSSRSSHGHGRRNSIDSEISFSVRHVSVESRRNSNDSQVSVKIAEMKTKVASRSRASKTKSRSSRHQRRADFTSKRYGRKESTTSMESQVLALTQKGAHSAAATAEMGSMLVPMNHHKRRSGIAELSPDQINELIAKNRFLLPYLTTSDDDISAGSFNIPESKFDAILKQMGISEHKIIDTKLNSDVNDDIESITGDLQAVEYSDLSSKENLASAARLNKSLNRSSCSKKGFKTASSARSRKPKKSSRSVARNANLTVTGSGKIKLDKKSDRKSKEIRKSQDEPFNSAMAIELLTLNGNLHGSISGRSDVGIQTEMAAQSMSSMEFAENLMKQDREQQQQEDEEDEEDAMEHFKLLPKRTSLSIAASKHRRDTHEISLTESEKLKLLLLPSK